MKNINDLTPAMIIPPGEVLADELKVRGITQKQFASTIGMQSSQLNEIIKGKRSISPQTALLLELHLNVSARFWLNLQTNYELEILRSKNISPKPSSNFLLLQDMKTSHQQAVNIH